MIPEPHRLLKDLTALSHDVARRLQTRVTGSVTSDLVGENFHKIRLEGRGIRFTLLLNAFHPLVGFAETEEHEPVFTDIPESFLGAAQTIFVFLGKAVLTLPPGEASLSRLAAAEIAQVNYWRPRRLGDIIFNHWD